jgi:hypothetical protein
VCRGGLRPTGALARGRPQGHGGGGGGAGRERGRGRKLGYSFDGSWWALSGFVVGYVFYLSEDIRPPSY